MSSWAPHSFFRQGIQAGRQKQVLDALVARGNKIHAKRAAVVFTLRNLAEECDVKYGFLRLVVERKLDPYRVFYIRKRSGGRREITVPDLRLMTVQKWITRWTLSRQQFHPVSTAFFPGSSPQKNASIHCGSRWLVKVDVHSFFDSVSERQVYRVFREMEYPSLLAFELTRLCTRLHSSGGRHSERRWHKNEKSYTISKYENDRVGCLPQGAPTSPMLANLVCQSLDRRLARLAEKYGGTITRYADDIVFSASDFDRSRGENLIADIKTELWRLGFKANSNKTAIVPPGARRVVTGLLVDSTVPRLPKAYRDNLTLHLFHARTKGLAAHCKRRKFRSIVGFRDHIRGLMSYATAIDPVFGAECEKSFRSIDWGVLSDI